MGAHSHQKASLHICRAYFSLKMADQWLSWRLDVIASFLVLIVALLAVSERGTLSPSLTALTLSQVRSQARLLCLPRYFCWPGLVNWRPQHVLVRSGAGRDGVPEVRGAVVSNV